MPGTHLRAAVLRAWIIAVIFGVAFCASSAWATVVVPMSLETIADHAGQVLVGRVAEVHSYWAGPKRGIESKVSFEEVEFLKNGAPQDGRRFHLTVPGGSIGERTMRVVGAPVFQIGQRWLLCLLPEYRTFPVVGIHRGAFRIVVGNDGVARVWTASGQPVTAIDGRGFVRTARDVKASTSSPVQGSGGNGIHLITEIRASTRAGAHKPTQPSSSLLNRPVDAKPDLSNISIERAMPYAEFVARLRPLLAASRQHALSEPAGRRITVEYTPTTLSGAGAIGDARPGEEVLTAEQRSSRQLPLPQHVRLQRAAKPKTPPEGNR